MSIFYSVFNFICASTYIALMFFIPMVITFCGMAGTVYSKAYLWLVAVFIAVFAGYMDKHIHVDPGLKVWGYSAGKVSCFLILAFFLFSIFYRK